MVDALAGALLSLTLALLDRYLDSQIDRLKDETLRGTLRRVEDEVMRVIAGPIGKAIAREVALRAGQRWFPNDPSTGAWG